MIPVIAIQQILKNKYVIALALFVFVCSSFYIYYSYASSKISRIEKENTLLQNEIENKNSYITSLKEDYSEIITSKEELSKLLYKTTKDLDKLRETLYRERTGKKSIGELASKKPSLIEKAINKAVQENISCFESLFVGEDC